MSAELIARMGIQPVLVDVGRGTFDVLCNDKLIFSKAKEGRHLKALELVVMLRALNK